MEMFFLKKRLACAVVFGFATIFSALNISQAYVPLMNVAYGELSNFKQTGEFNFGEIDSEINRTVAGRDIFLEMFGYLQLVMGKSEQAGFETVKDNDGFLHKAYFTTQAESLLLADTAADEIIRIRNGIENAEFLYVLQPSRLQNREQLPSGMPYTYENEAADYMLKRLGDNGVDFVDLRESLKSSGKSREETFYKTAPFWKTETGFWAFCELVGEMNDRYEKLNLDESGKYRDLDNYNVITYEDSYLGEYGRKTGKYYANTDDFTVIYPKFKTSLRLTSYHDSLEPSVSDGLFEDVLLSARILRGETIYSDDTDKFFAYYPSGTGFCRLENYRQLNAPKIVIIANDMMNPTACFMSTVFSSVYIINPAAYAGDTSALTARINALKADYVIAAGMERGK